MTCIARAGGSFCAPRQSGGRPSACVIFPFLTRKLWSAGAHDPQRPSVRQCRSTAPLHSRSIRGEELKCRSSTPTFGSTTKLQHILLALIGAGMAGARMASSAGTVGAVGAVGSTGMSAADKLQERISSVNSSGSGGRNGGSPASSPSSRMNSTVSPSATLGNQGASSSIKNLLRPLPPLPRRRRSSCRMIHQKADQQPDESRGFDAPPDFGANDEASIETVCKATLAIPWTSQCQVGILRQCTIYNESSSF